MCSPCVCVSQEEVEVMKLIPVKSFLGELTCVGQFLHTWSVLAWLGSFAPALPKSNQIASEQHLNTSTIAIVRVAILSRSYEILMSGLNVHWTICVL